MRSFYIEKSMGDIVCALPAIRAAGGGTIYTGLPIDQYRSIFSLVSKQEYVSLFLHESTDGLPQGFTNLSSVSYMHTPGQHIAKNFAEKLGVAIDLNEPWLELPDGISPMVFPFKDYAVINITPRYRDKIYNYRKELLFLLKNSSHLFFLGERKEYWDFANKYGEGVATYWPTESLFQAALIIKGAKYFTCTQSCLLAIAQGLGRSYRYERSPYSDNTQTHRPNETVLNPRTRKWHLALTRTQEIIKNFRSK